MRQADVPAGTVRVLPKETHMTAVLAQCGRGWCSLTADRRFTNQHGEVSTSGEPKIVKRGNILIGYAGMPDQFLEFLARWKPCLADVNEIRKQVRAMCGDKDPVWNDTDIVIAIPGKILCTQGNTALLYSDRLVSIGTGGTTAQAAAAGALATAKGLSDRKVGLLGIKIAAQLHSDVGGPCDYLRIG